MNFKWGGIAAGFGFVFSLLIGLVSGAGAIALVRALVIGVVFFGLGAAAYIVVSRYLGELLELVPGSGEPDVPSDGPGSQVDISIGDSDDTSGDEGPPLFGDADGSAGTGAPDTGFEHLDAFPGETDTARARPASTPGAEIRDMPSAALDQINEDRYTGKGSVEGRAGEALSPPEESSDGTSVDVPSVDGTSADASSVGEVSVGALPDLEAMSRAFLATAREADGPSDLRSVGLRSAKGASGDGTYSLSVSGKAPYMGAKPAELEGDFKPKDIAQAIQTILKRD